MYHNGCRQSGPGWRCVGVTCDSEHTCAIHASSRLSTQLEGITTRFSRCVLVCGAGVSARGGMHSRVAGGTVGAALGAHGGVDYAAEAVR